MVTGTPAAVGVKDVGVVVVVDGGESLSEFTNAGCSVLCPICDVRVWSVSFWSHEQLPYSKECLGNIKLS